MKYSPKNELTDEQLKRLSEDEFFEYLDSKSAYLKRSTVPLDNITLKNMLQLHWVVILVQNNYEKQRKLVSKVS